MLESEWLGTGDEIADLAAVDWRRQQRLSGCGLERTMETQWLWSGDNNGDFVAGDWRR